MEMTSFGHLTAAHVVCSDSQMLSKRCLYQTYLSRGVTVHCLLLHDSSKYFSFLCGQGHLIAGTERT